LSRLGEVASPYTTRRRMRGGEGVKRGKKVRRGGRAGDTRPDHTGIAT